MKFKRLRDSCFEIIDLNILKEDLKDLGFVTIEGDKECGYLVLHKGEYSKLDKFFSRDWIFQIQQDRKLKTWWVMLTDNALLNVNNFNELEEIIGLLENNLKDIYDTYNYTLNKGEKEVKKMEAESELENPEEPEDSDEEEEDSEEFEEETSDEE